MKMPNSREISDEQEEIYAEAPMDGSILIVGPPGTGKTVIAFLRAQALSRCGKAVKVLMYNKVLQKYTENVASADGSVVASSTLHRWVNKWWLAHGIRTEPNNTDKVYIDCPFGEKDEAKALGAKWDKRKFNPGKARGQWYVPAEAYSQNEKAFTRWEAKNITAPEIEQFQYDWDKMLLGAVGHGPMNDWGHLIIDEGQDFPEKMYNFLRFIGMGVENGDLTIMADENQRLTIGQNSTIEQIKSALAIKDDRYFKLNENFRNTRQIAKVASHFYVGLASGQPELPRRQGDLPQLVATTNIEQQVDFIVRMLTSRAPGEVGVFTQNESMRKQLLAKLQPRLPEHFRVQSYSSYDSANHSAEDLVFDTTGTVTIINRQSCKGLEFDMVFIPELQAMDTEGSGEDVFKMNMYVMCSRARQTLCLLYSSQSGEVPDIVNFMPEKSSGLLEYTNA